MSEIKVINESTLNLAQCKFKNAEIDELGRRAMRVKFVQDATRLVNLRATCIRPRNVTRRKMGQENETKKKSESTSMRYSQLPFNDSFPIFIKSTREQATSVRLPSLEMSNFTLTCDESDTVVSCVL